MNAVVSSLLVVWSRVMPVLRLLLRRFFLGFLSIHKELQQIGMHVARSERSLNRRIDHLEEMMSKLVGNIHGNNQSSIMPERIERPTEHSGTSKEDFSDDSESLLED